MKIEPIKQQWKLCRGGAEQSRNEDEQVVEDDTLSQCSEPMSQDDQKHYCGGEPVFQSLGLVV